MLSGRIIILIILYVYVLTKLEAECLHFCLNACSLLGGGGGYFMYEKVKIAGKYKIYTRTEYKVLTD